MTVDILAALRRADAESLWRTESDHGPFGGACVLCGTAHPCQLLRAVRLINDRDPDTGSTPPAVPEI
ncbi:hypothetical protein Afil01_31700 [Actinorhabdospora filicis]|uniref:Uncharacterized protein n=1 Tax=Actinorhabdospora filicis TaxID=1785913 RepID=A0A9W6SLC5_9ACTN|nr:hypothetical protein [Actinorhabdospora filicis]GLZ78363.1 hypothetical protein Afil01_31700 [Actinorhabdospora filicis]